MKQRFVLEMWAVLALLQGEEPPASIAHRLSSTVKRCLPQQ